MVPTEFREILVMTRPWLPYAPLAALVFAAAMYVRVLGYDATPLWLDEAWRANFVLDPNWLANTFDGSSSFATITSFAYGGLNRFFAFCESSSRALRLTSLLPSILAVLLTLFVVSRLSGSRMLGISAAIAAALNLTYIQYAKEFKPYSFELFLHVAVIAIALLYIDALKRASPPGRTLRALMLGAGPLAAICGPNSVFILPGYYLIILLAEVKVHPRIPIALFASGAVTLALLAAQYLLVWSGAGHDGLLSYWQANFYTEDAGSRASWIAQRYKEMVESAFQARPSLAVAGPQGVVSPDVYQRLAAILRPAWLVALMVGLFASAAQIRNKPELFLLLALPLLGLTVANALWLWPLGAVRPNVFAYFYVSALAFVGLAAIPNVWWRGCISAAILLWYGVLHFPDDATYFATQATPPRQEVTAALVSVANRLPNRCDDRVLLLTTSASSHAVQFYTQQDTRYDRRAAARLIRCTEIRGIPVEAYSDPEGFVSRTREVMGTYYEAWIVWTHLNEAETLKMLQALSGVGWVSEAQTYPGAGWMRLELVRAPAPTSPPRNRQDQLERAPR